MNQRPGRQQLLGAGGGQLAAKHEHQHAAGAQPEQRDRDRQEREVVIHRHREDARQRQLGHQQCGGDGGNAEQRGAVCHVAWQSIGSFEAFDPNDYDPSVATVVLAALALGWLVLLVAAPVAPTSLATLLYAAGSFICHQRPERSFHIDAAQLPVCARCLGIYAGAAIGSAESAGSRARPRVPAADSAGARAAADADRRSCSR